MDSTQVHGFGTYEFRNNIVAEILLLEPPNMNIDQRKFELNVAVDENSFKQVIETVSNDTTYQQIEVYKKLSK